MNPSEKKYDIITFGDLCVDLLMSGRDVTPEFGQVEKIVDDYALEMGGSCSIFACQAAKLGLRVGILGRVGPDDFGRLILRRMNESGVDTRHVMVDPSLKTGVGIALCRGSDRAILTYLVLHLRHQTRGRHRRVSRFGAAPSLWQFFSAHRSATRGAVPVPRRARFGRISIARYQLGSRRSIGRAVARDAFLD